MNEARELLNREVQPALLEELREVIGLPFAVGSGATLFDVLRRSALERAETSAEWPALCARRGFTGGEADE